MEKEQREEAGSEDQELGVIPKEGRSNKQETEEDWLQEEYRRLKEEGIIEWPQNEENRHEGAENEHLERNPFPCKFLVMAEKEEVIGLGQEWQPAKRRFLEIIDWNGCSLAENSSGSWDSMEERRRENK
ncbi:hypothetical protein R1sor_002672 [Riccia sorocarpa]|uniref:Uncharacterized protein n=1 Tax=Riccia sorocarpa TaxID=122646 RepID=A0ABD3H2M3_9MARC